MTSAGRRSRQSDRRRQRRPSRQRSSRGTGCASAAVLWREDRKSTRLNSSHVSISYAVFCLKKKKKSDLSTQSCKNKEERKQQHHGYALNFFYNKVPEPGVRRNDNPDHKGSEPRELAHQYVD